MRRAWKISGGDQIGHSQPQGSKDPELGTISNSKSLITRPDSTQHPRPSNTDLDRRSPASSHPSPATPKRARTPSRSGSGKNGSWTAEALRIRGVGPGSEEAERQCGERCVRRRSAEARQELAGTGTMTADDEDDGCGRGDLAGGWEVGTRKGAPRKSIFSIAGARLL